LELVFKLADAAPSGENAMDVDAAPDAHDLAMDTSVDRTA
jgi:hypothetical protein